MKVVVVTQYYAPEDARIPTDIARQLSARGHSVTVVTAFPSYPHGKVFEGYKQRARFVELDGEVRVRRVRTIISHSQNPLGRIASYMSFGFSSALARKETRGADVVYVYATQMTAAIGPVLWRIFGGPKFVLHVQDLWPESVTQSSLVKPGVISKLMNAVMNPFLRFTYRRAAHVLAIAPTMKELLLKRGAKEEATSTVFNWASEDGAGGATRIRTSHGTSIVYAGNIGPLQDLENVVEAGAAVSDVEGLTITLFGSGLSEEVVRQTIERVGARNVRFEGRLPREQMGSVYSRSDFQLVTLKDLPIFRGTIPSKLSASLHAGIPVITNIAGDVADLVRENKLGVVCAPDSVEALSEAFLFAHKLSRSERAAMGSRCRSYYKKAMSRQSGIDRIETVLSDIVIG
ncbi:MAG: glycosyltransferase family 4 protein [Cryobacterium sp.]|nr:glycosyltransferase family 4 protein [Cryobacterium sp.]